MSSINDLEQISKRLQKAMIKSKLSYGEISNMINIPKSAVHRYINGETPKIPLDRLKLLAKALNVTPAYLMGWEEEIEPNAEQKATAPELRAEIKELVNAASDLPTEKIKTLTQVAESMKNT